MNDGGPAEAPPGAVAACGDLVARRTTETDLPFVLAAESDPENRPFVGQWSHAEHLATLRDPACAHLLLTAGPGARLVGYAILRNLASPDRSIEFKRLVVTEKGKGHGRGALRLVTRHAFEALGAHRLWLDVMDHNVRARHLYASEGFVHEGTLRECLLRDGRFVSIHLMSIVEAEYRRGGGDRPAGPGEGGAPPRAGGGPEVSVGPLEPGDREAVRAIFLEGIASGDATFETRAPSWEEWDAAHRADCRLAARAGGAVVGWAALSPTSGRCVYGGVAEVSVYVAARARGRGAGTALLRALVEASERAGIWTLQAGIFPENLASLALHRRCGFRDVGRRERLGRDARAGWRDVLLLERRSAGVGRD